MEKCPNFPQYDITVFLGKLQSLRAEMLCIFVKRKADFFNNPLEIPATVWYNVGCKRDLN